MFSGKLQWEGVSQMALIVSGIERSGNSDGSFSIVLQSGDGELNAVVPQNLVLPCNLRFSAICFILRLTIRAVVAWRFPP